MENTVTLHNKMVSCISLSDNGSTLSFASAQFIKKHKLPIMGTWRGNLQTLNDVKNVSTNFFKLTFRTSNGDHAVLALETANLGDYYGLNHKMCLKFSSHFGLSPDDILCTSSKPIDILLGLDAAALLLDKLFVLNGRQVSSPQWAPNVFLYGSPASNKFSLVGRMNSHYPVDNIRDRNSAQGIFYFTDESKLVSCKPLLQSGLYTHHIDPGQTAVTYSDPPVRETKQVQNCEPTPADQVFSNSDLIKIVDKAVTIRDNPIPAASLPSFVSMHKVFLVACALCLFHNEGTCATISASRFLEDGQLTLDD